MKKSVLYFFACSFLLYESCSKKEMIKMPATAQAVTDKTSSSKQITWMQGDPIINGTYNIFRMGTSKALEVADGITNDGSRAQVNNFMNHNFQNWNITDVGNGYFKIINLGSGKALEAGKELHQNHFTGANEQLWKIEHQKLGLYKITNKATALAVTLDDAGTTGTKVTQSTYTGAGPQLMAITLRDFSIADDSVTIDFSSLSTEDIKHVASGFLHGFTANAKPDDSLLLPLKINTVRDWIFGYPTRAPHLNDLGYKQQLVVSDSWAQPYNSNGPPGNNDDWTRWENHVKGTVSSALAVVPSANLQYDLWNEPNLGGFWNFTGQYAFPGWFFETWKHGYIAARSVDANAVMVGPSYSSYDIVNLKAFLLYCKANNCVPNYLSWHFPTSPAAQVAEMNQFMADNDIHVDGICINEYTLSGQQTAGKNAYLIAQLERAKVASAMHAIWGSTESGQLDGIVTTASDGNKKKATWWVYKAYGDITGKIVKTTNTANIELIAGLTDSPRALNVLLGNRAKVGEGLIKVKFLNVTSAITNGTTSSHIKFQRIPDQLNVGAVVNSPTTLIDKDFTITYGDSMTLLINWDNEYDAYTIHVEKQ